jgi:hypothetical protein
MRHIDWIKLAVFVMVLAVTVAAFWFWSDHTGSGLHGPRHTP